MPSLRMVFSARLKTSSSSDSSFEKSCWLEPKAPSAYPRVIRITKAHRFMFRKYVSKGCALSYKVLFANVNFGSLFGFVAYDEVTDVGHQTH